MPEEPVLSPVSNNVFERRLVVKFIEENGTDPMNGEPLGVEQLLEIKGDLEIFTSEGVIIMCKSSVVLIEAHLEQVKRHISSIVVLHDGNELLDFMRLATNSCFHEQFSAAENHDNHPLILCNPCECLAFLVTMIQWHYIIATKK